MNFVSQLMKRDRKILEYLKPYLAKNLLSVMKELIVRKISDFRETQEEFCFSPRAIPIITDEELKEHSSYVTELFLPSTAKTKELFENDPGRYWFLNPSENDKNLYMYVHIWYGPPEPHQYCKYEVTNEEKLIELFLSL